MNLSNMLFANASNPAVIPADAGILICHKSKLSEKGRLENQLAD